MSETTQFPSTIKITQSRDDDEWPHTLSAKDDRGSEVRLYLSSDVFQMLLRACEQPEVEEEL